MREERNLVWDRGNNRLSKTRYGRKNEEDPDVDFQVALFMSQNPTLLGEEEPIVFLNFSIFTLVFKPIFNPFNRFGNLWRISCRITIIFQIVIAFKLILFSYRDQKNQSSSLSHHTFISSTYTMLISNRLINVKSSRYRIGFLTIGPFPHPPTSEPHPMIEPFSNSFPLNLTSIFSTNSFDLPSSS